MFDESEDSEDEDLVAERYVQRRMRQERDEKGRKEKRSMKEKEREYSGKETEKGSDQQDKENEGPTDALLETLILMRKESKSNDARIKAQIRESEAKNRKMTMKQVKNSVWGTGTVKDRQNRDEFLESMKREDKLHSLSRLVAEKGNDEETAAAVAKLMEDEQQDQERKEFVRMNPAGAIVDAYVKSSEHFSAATLDYYGGDNMKNIKQTMKLDTIKAQLVKGSRAGDGGVSFMCESVTEAARDVYQPGSAGGYGQGQGGHGVKRRADSGWGKTYQAANGRVRDRSENGNGFGGEEYGAGKQRKVETAQRYQDYSLVGKAFNIKTHQGKCRDGQCRMRGTNGALVICDRRETLTSELESASLVGQNGRDNGKFTCTVCGGAGHKVWECSVGRGWLKEGLCDERYVVASKFANQD